MGLRKFLGRHALSLGYVFDKAAPERDTAGVIAALRPFRTEHELIRIGPSSDGGYLVPNDLDGLVACFSPGVKDSAGFEFDIAERGIPCFMADYSVDAAPLAHPRFHFRKNFIGASDRDHFISMNTWVRTCAPPVGDLMLQMDIEGYEYESILAMSPDVLGRFRILIVEFHNLDGLFSRKFLPLADATFRKITDQFDVVHIHANNSRPIVSRGRTAVAPVAEFTFLRKDRSSVRTPEVEIPHRLDVICKPGRPDIVIPANWLGRP